MTYVDYLDEGLDEALTFDGLDDGVKP